MVFVTSGLRLQLTAGSTGFLNGFNAAMMGGRYRFGSGLDGIVLARWVLSASSVCTLTADWKDSTWSSGVSSVVVV